MKIILTIIITLALINVQAKPGPDIPKKIQGYINTLDTIRVSKKAALLNKICWKLRNVDADLSREYGQQAIDLSLENGNAYDLMQAYSFTGVAFRNLGYYEEALNYYSKGLQLALRLDQKEQQCYAYINIANLHIYLGKPFEAIEYLKTVHPTAQQVGNKNILGYIHLNYGRAHLALDEFKQALEHINKALVLRIENDNLEGQSVCKKYIGDVYHELGNQNAAITNYKTALDIMNKANDKDLYAATLNGLARAYLASSGYLKAKTIAKQSLSVSQEVNSLLRSKEAIETLSEVARAKGDYQEAEQLLREVIILKDKLYTEDLSRQTERFSFTLKNRELTYQKEKQALKFAEEKKRTIIISIAATSTLVILILLGGGLYINKRKAEMHAKNVEIVRKQNSVLEEKVQERTKELYNKNERLQQLSNYKEELTHMIAHDLKNPLNMIIGLSENSIDKYKAKNIKEAGQVMLQMVMNMLDIQKFEEAKINISHSTFLLSKTVKKVQSQTEYLLKSKSINFETNIEAQLTIYADEELVLRILINLISNAAKHTDSGGEISLRARTNPTGDRVHVAIEDTGHGIAPEYIGQIFDKYWHAEAKKLGTSNSTGLGLTFCKMAIEAHGGQISVESELNHGTTFHFDLPVGEFYKVENQVIPSKPSIDPRRLFFGEQELEEITLISEKLKDTPLYEVGTISEILHEFESDSEMINQWKNELLQATYNWDEERFKNLLKHEAIHQA